MRVNSVKGGGMYKGPVAGEIAVPSRKGKKARVRDFPGGQWLGLCPSNAGGKGSIPGRGTKSPHTTWHSQEKKEGQDGWCAG